MATIIQFPNSISFLENLKAVRIASSETVAFKLSSGGAVILEETYSPGPSGIVEVELRDVISEYLAIAYPSSDVFNQASAIAQMTVSVDGGSGQNFTVLSGGVRGLSTTDESFLRANWLTWQPQTKTVRWNQPEYLTFAHLSAGTVKAKFYTKSGGTETVTIYSASAGQVNTYRMQMSTLFAASSYEPEGLYGLVDVWVEKGGVQQSYVQRYVCTPETRDEHYFSCVNSLGGIDTFCFTGPQTLAPSVEHAAALRGDRKIDITPAPERSWTQNTGDLDKAESKWIWDFFNSSRHWAAIDGELEEIVIESSSVRASDAENLNAFDFAFSPVNTGRTMKIDRTSGQLPAMQVLSPTGDLFFLAPRIVDYPDATIDESLLLLTQSPLVQEWQKIGIGPLCDYLSDQIHNTSWGQLAHTHSNKTVIDALSEQGGKLLFNGQPVTPDIPQMPDHYIAGTKAKTEASDDELKRITKISFTAATAASESVDLEVVTINGQRYLHTSLPFFSDSEITAGGVGSGETPGPATTLGALLNVDSVADNTPTTDKILVREAGSTHWTIADFSDISGAVTGVKGDAETDYRIGNVNITKANIGLGNVENTALSTWAGSANITKLGTITSGTWHGTAITKTYLSSSVQTSLDKADGALQNHQSIYQLTVQKNGVQMGTYTPNSAASTINIPDVASAQTLADLKTWIESMFEKDTASIPGKTLIHAKYDLYSNGEITAGGVGSGGGGGGSIVTWTQIQGAEGGVKIATITINGNVIDVYAPAGSIPPTPTDTYVFERYTASPVSVGASGGTVTIRVTSTKNGVNQHLNTSGITVTGGATVQSVSSSDNVTATLSIPNNTGAARSFSVTLIQPESGMSLTYSISQEAGQIVTGEVVDLKGIWSVSDRYQDTYAGYRCYKSNNHTDGSVGKMTVTLIGRSSFMMYFRSEAESGYDGLIANLDSEPTKEGANYFIDTKGRQHETFSVQLRDFGLDTGTHTVYAQYIKDDSQSTDPDEAYVWVPSEIPYVNSY